MRIDAHNRIYMSSPLLLYDRNGYGRTLTIGHEGYGELCEAMELALCYVLSVLLLCVMSIMVRIFCV